MRMPSPFANAISAALATVNAVAGERGTYWRGTQSTTEISATPGNAVRDRDDVEQVQVLQAARDWIFKASELLIGGTVVLPERGDQWRVTDAAGVTTIYEVENDGNQVYRWSDSAHTRLRVHTIERPAGAFV